MLACAAVLVLAVSPFAYAQAVDLADARSDTSGGGPEMLEYESSGLNVTGAELLDFPFLSISVEFTDDAGDRALTVFFADPLFDPVFDPEGYQLDIITDVGLHDSFETSGRNMTITNLPVGIESIDIYLSARDAAEDAVPDGDSPAAQDPDPGAADAGASDDEAVGGDAAQDQPTDAPEPVAGEVQQQAMSEEEEGVTGDTAGDGGSGATSNMPSEAGETPGVGETPPQPSQDGPASGEPSIECGPGTVLVDDVCILEEPPESDMEEAESYTAPAPQNGGDTRADNRDLIFGAAGGFLAAGVIAVLLALIHRADRRRR